MLVNVLLSKQVGLNYKMAEQIISYKKLIISIWRKICCINVETGLSSKRMHHWELFCGMSPRKNGRRPGFIVIIIIVFVIYLL